MGCILKRYGMKILIIEDDRFYANNLKKVIENELNYSVEVVNINKDLITKDRIAKEDLAKKR